jgi:hypothetical protein
MKGTRSRGGRGEAKGRWCRPTYPPDHWQRMRKGENITVAQALCVQRFEDNEREDQKERWRSASVLER